MTGPLVDVHVHLYADRSEGERAKAGYEIWEYGDDPGVTFSDAAGDLTGLRETYRDGGFDHAVVLEFFDTSAERHRLLARVEDGLGAERRRAVDADADVALADALREANRRVVAATVPDPTLSAFVCIDPTLMDAAEIRLHLAEMSDAGAVGVKLHPVAHGLEPGDVRLDAVYDLCQQSGLVILSHSGAGRSPAAGARPAAFAPVMDRFPRLRLILAHLGGAAWQEAEALAEAYPTVLFDLSEIIEWDGAPGAPSAAVLAGVVQRIGAERVMLGSDFPWYDPVRTAARVAALPGLGAGEVAAVLGGTAVEALGLPSSRRD